MLNFLKAFNILQKCIQPNTYKTATSPKLLLYFADTPERAKKYLTTIFYDPSVSSDDCTREYLGQVLEHLRQILEAPDIKGERVERPDGWEAFGVKYAQVMALLGMPVEEVEAAFKKAISLHPDDKYLIQAKIRFGCYYISIGEYEKARLQLEHTSTQSKTSHNWRKIAQCGLRVIRYN